MQQKTLLDYEVTDVTPQNQEQCPFCKKPFDTKKGVSAHAWQVHDERPYQIELECDYCGADIQRHKDNLYETNFCDSTCQYAYQTGENHQNANRDTRPCTNCGTDITRCVGHFGEYPMCSRDCYAEWLSENRAGEDHHQWTREQVECEYCTNPIWRKKHQLDGRRHFCSYDCHHTWLRENSTPQTRVDAVRKHLSDYSWSWIAELYHQDESRQCSMCGSVPTSETGHNATHHIIPIMSGGTNADELLMPLCDSCHVKAERYTKAIPEVQDFLSEPN